MRLSLALLVAAVAAGGALALAQPDPGAPHPSPFMRGHAEFMGKLNLSDKQKSDIAKLRAETEKAAVGIQSKIKIARIDLRTLASAEAPDKSALEGKLKEISELQYQEKKLVLDHVFDVYALLTPEQQKTFRAGMLKRLAGGGMGPWHGMDGGMGGWQGGMRGHHGEMPDSGAAPH